MPTPVFTSITRGEIMLAVARKVGDCITDGGTTTTGAANTLVDAVATGGLQRYLSDSDPRIYRKLLTVYKGTRAGDTVAVSAYTASSRTITPSPSFGGNIATDTKYFIHIRWDQKDYTEAIQGAHRLLNFNPALGRGIMKEVVSREIMLGNALINPVFDLYTTANTPDGWTTTNLTVTQETTVTYGGCRRSLKVITDGANVANLTQSLGEVGRWKGQSFEAWAWVWCETASELFLRVNDGVDNHDSSKHGGTGWEKLKVTVTPAAVAGSGFDAMTAAIRSTTAGSTLTFYVQVVWVPQAPTNDHRYPLDADINLVVLNPHLRVSGVFSDTGGKAGTFEDYVDNDAWEIVYEATRKLRLHIGSQWNGRILEYTGWKNHAELSAITTTWAGPINPLVEVAAALLHAMKVSPQSQPSPEQAGAPAGYGAPEQVAALMLQHYGVRVPGGWRLIETIQ